jgi:hypothetical protein
MENVFIFQYTDVCPAYHAQAREWELNTSHKQNAYLKYYLRVFSHTDSVLFKIIY